MKHSNHVSILAAFLLAATLRLAAAELTVEDFRLDGPLGSEGATIEKIGRNHFLMTVGHAPEHPDWANTCQFEIIRHARGNSLVLDVRFDHKEPKYRFHDYFYSWSHDGQTWHPIHWCSKGDGQRNRLVFPVFEQDRVLFGLQVPMPFETAESMLLGWSRHPHAKLHVVGESLGGRKLYRLEITDPDGQQSRAARWVHYFKSEHPGEHNAQWRMAGMIEWLLSDAGAGCRRNSIMHFVLMMSPDSPSKGWYRVNAQGVDMNRSYRVAGADAKEQAHEAFLFQRDLEELMASEAPVTTAWQMHTCAGLVEPMVTAGPEIGSLLGPPEQFHEIMRKNDPAGLVEPVSFMLNENLLMWTGGVHKQFGITAVLCEGAGSIFTKEDNMASGVVLVKSIAEYYRGSRPQG